MNKDNRWIALFRSWHVQFFALILCLLTFFAVGIVASTATFSEVFLRAYFVIAIVWTLSSSLLVFLLVRLFGGEIKDAVAAFLAAIGLWLVVIQVCPKNHEDTCEMANVELDWAVTRLQTARNRLLNRSAFLSL